MEVEYNGTASNRILVAPRMATLPPPAGFVYVDPMTFTITTETPPTPGDKLKVDYIFTPSVKAAGDVARGTIGRLDPASNQFVTTGLGEFEFEVYHYCFFLPCASGDKWRRMRLTCRVVMYRKRKMNGR